MARSCRPLTPAEQIRAVERQVGHKLSRMDQLDVVGAGQEFICVPPGTALARRQRRQSRLRPRRRR
jgi:hypothetical protein